jgi:hypothetical protein
MNGGGCSSGPELVASISSPNWASLGSICGFTILTTQGSPRFELVEEQRGSKLPSASRAPGSSSASIGIASILWSRVQGRLAVECDGDEWHGPDRYEQDMARQRDLERAGWQFVRFRGK